jgi:hypothetical protein
LAEVGEWMNKFVSVEKFNILSPRPGATYKKKVLSR